MSKIRKNHSDTFKFRVALEALKENKSVVELSQEFGIMSSQIYAWKQQLKEQGASVFADKRCTENKKKDIDKLHKTIGQLVMEKDFLEAVLDRSK